MACYHTCTSLIYADIYTLTVIYSSCCKANGEHFTNSMQKKPAVILNAEVEWAANNIKWYLPRQVHFNL